MREERYATLALAIRDSRVVRYILSGSVAKPSPAMNRSVRAVVALVSRFRMCASLRVSGDRRALG
eukprot:scaffold18410_cov30-Tisochrysis_lutea.AAC.1